MKLKDFVAEYEAFCPKELALEGDPVGLQVGSPEMEIKKVLVTLDIREQVVEEAIRLGVDLILAKHPLIFSPLKNLTSLEPQEKLVLDLASHHIAVYTSHSNIDVVKGGLNDYFAEMLGMTDLEVLDDAESLGRVGNIEPTSLADFSEKVKKALGQERLRLISYDQELKQEIRRIAVCGGSGAKLWPIAKAKGADLYITADVYYHVGHDMLSGGLLGIDPGHYMEQYFIPLVARKLESFDSDVEVIQSQANTNPFYDI
ncbi:Nif3-like dinuclear metal center hexameric protein [Lactococcus termiticola]|uniref:GTP cyclohydrolase 1 type 2 homolog n=1 Tax=Lactococcus termiticola TaxID=2169526 RepID=A0A2R5HGU0_9LACT|nr:Nif3-like dinuclear metal center hexameric protein [Lactococcus termiticola]GBG97076.1 Nif3-like dinuclear metal center hexameric protein [Lactococcus termiticola]